MNTQTGAANTGGTEYGFLRNAFFELNRDKPLQDVFDHFYMFLGNPPHLIADCSFICSPKGSSFADSSFLDLIRDSSPICHESLYILTAQKYTELQHRTNMPILINCSHLGIRMLTAKIMHRGRIAAQIILPESEGAFGAHDPLYLQLLAEWVKDKIDDEQGDIYNQIFTETMLEKCLREDASSETGFMLPRSLQRRPMFIAFAYVNEASFDDFKNNYRRASKSIHFCCATFFDGGFVYLCVPEDDEQMKKMREYFDAFSQNDIAVGISSVFSDCKKIRSHFFQAKKMAALYESSANNKPKYFSENIVESFLRETSKHIQISKYVDERFRMLRQTDIKRASTYADTLVSFIQCGANIHDTCEQMGIHRNTLSKRLLAIEKNMGQKLDICENLFEYLLQNKLVEYDEAEERGTRLWQ